MKILLIEDDPDIRATLRESLEYFKHTIDDCADGQVGVDLALNEFYDVVILDRMLPVLSGDEVCRQLKQQRPTVPILMLTAKSSLNETVNGLDLGADDYMAKPFALKELQARLRALTRRMPQSSESLTQGTILQNGDLELDFAKMQVSRAQQPIHLSATESVLLEFLMRHPGQVFNKQQLTERVWSFDADVLPNTAQVYIGYLRKKIDEPFKNQKNFVPMIETIHGFGYKLRKVEKITYSK